MDALADDPVELKRLLRQQMRALRRGLPDLEQRSQRLFAHVRGIPAVAEAGMVMAFSSVHGEPVTAEFVTWCRAAGKTVVMPEDDPAPDPSAIDVVIVPGTAFTLDGHRLGQGGGWYDRFLAQLTPACLKVGVCFGPQLVPELPVEPHDVRLDLVVTEAGPHWPVGYTSS
jgi:5-formyltetrahydrofolate cyclo-ligase